MTTTPNLSLPYLAAGQAQKHVTHNEALRMLDALVMLTAADRDLSAPPPAPVEGARYIVNAPGSGAFTGKDNEIGHYADGGWLFYPPQAGWTCFVADEQALLVFDGDAWVAAIDALGGVSELQNLTRLGVGTAADATNPFAAKLNNASWTARTDGEGGNGDLRYKLNKEAAGKTLSLLMQSGSSGRAEIGLTGDDDFHFKVSADGATWREAILIDKDTGEVSFPHTSIEGGRELLAASRTYYVRADGSDANTGLANTSGGAFLTIQKAVDVAAALDLSIHDVTIQIAAGTYAAPLVLKSTVGAGKITIRGDTTTPANVTISATGASAVSGHGYAGRYRLEGVKLTTATSGHAIHITGAKLEIGQVDFGAVAGSNNHIFLEAQAYLLVAASYSVTGAAGVHWAIRSGSYLDCRSLTISLIGTPAFSIFAYADLLANMLVASNTFSGAATGQRYNIASNSILFTGGAGVGYLPGSSSGASATGAQYL
jgi:hypothetical protein